MKTKIVIFLIVSAIATLSFSFVSHDDQSTAKVSPGQSTEIQAPIGGFAFDDAI